MEDTQPNEVRLSRKGSANIPRVRISHPAHAPYPKRPRWQPPAARPSSRTDGPPGYKLVEIHLHLPRECHKGAPGSHNARKRWVEEQKYHLRVDRHLSVLSFRHLVHDNKVLFTCRVQSTTHSVRDNTGSGLQPVDAHPDTERTGISRQAQGYYSDLTQSNKPGPSRIRPTSHSSAGLGSFAQCLDNQSSIPSSGYSAETKPIEPSTTEIKSRPLRTLHSNPVPQPRVAVRTAPQTGCAIGSTIDNPGAVAERHPVRWSTFRSGYVDILFPAFSGDFTIPSPKANTNPRSSINQTLAHVMEQREDVPVIRNNTANPHTTRPDICANDTISTRSAEDHQVCGSHLDQLHQHNVLEVGCSSYPRDYSAEVLSSPPDYSPSVRGFTFAYSNLLLSLGPHDKPRRILHDHDFTCVITAHGIIDQVSTTSVLKLDRHIRSPSLPFEEFVDDACILSYQGDSVIVLGHAREQDQVTLLGCDQVLRHITLRRDWDPVKRPGVSAVTSLMSPLKFASGGYDHRLHIWDIRQDLSGASAVELAVKHSSLVHSLLYVVDTSHRLISVGADRDVPIYDLSAERVVQTLKTSCTPYHAHKTDSRFCTLLEVSHLETQFELRDHRLPNQAVQRFGFLTDERRRRFEKADSWSHFVACGDRNGTVRLWDLRNVSAEVTLRQCFNDPVIQVVNTGPGLLACSKRNEVACINF